MKRLGLVLAFSCALISTALAQERLRIVTTTSDLRSLAKIVGAERVTVSSLVPPGERPEGFQPALQNVAILKGARIVVRAGAGIDPWFDKLLARSAEKNGPTGIERGEGGHIDASSLMAANDPLLVSAGFARNRRGQRTAASPHFWLDPKSAETITGKILETFSKLDPTNKKYYEDNRNAFLSRLSAKMNDWTARLAPMKGEPLLAFHDDWAYFANRFGLTIVDFISTRDRSPPQRARMGELVKLIKDRNIRLIIVEASQPERHANRLADQTGAKVVQLAGSVGMLPNTDDYIAMIDANVNLLVAANGKK